MRAIDTNVLVRLVVRDDADQARAAEECIATGGWVSHVVLAQTMWVLDAVYERSAEQIGELEQYLQGGGLDEREADKLRWFVRECRPNQAQ